MSNHQAVANWPEFKERYGRRLRVRVVIMQWRKVNDLLVPVAQSKKPTQQDLKNMYYSMHCCCPSCGSNCIETTCVGYIFVNIETAKDSNKATCVCGWHGTVHDLVPSA